jgi:hypothetical protein
MVLLTASWEALACSVLPLSACAAVLVLRTVGDDGSFKVVCHAAVLQVLHQRHLRT